jgi:uncharacterized protein
MKDKLKSKLINLNLLLEERATSCAVHNRHHRNRFNRGIGNDMKLKEVQNLLLEQDIPTVGFSSWLRGTRRTWITEEGANVPCGECKACCTSSYFVHIRPDETQTLDRIPKELLFAYPRLSKGNVILGYDEKGHCPMFIDNHCSIYDHRPLTCRNYDCRIFSATGLTVDEDKKNISQQARRWKFDFPAAQDHQEFFAVQAAAKFIRDCGECFPAEFVPGNTTQQAVLAIKVYEVFMPSVNGSRNNEPTDQCHEIVKTIMAAYERFEMSDMEPMWPPPLASNF